MGFGERRMVDVRSMDLHCADCGKKIEELPFQPSSDRPVYCQDCNRKRRPPREGGSRGGTRGGRY
jgi:CxxC-x17-CxxC domain-containing protein